MKRNKLFFTLPIAFVIYTITYYFLINTNDEVDISSTPIIERVGFSRLTIKANPRTMIEPGLAYQIRRLKDNTLIRPIYILKVITDEFSEETQYFIEAPNDQLDLLLIESPLAIYDLDFKLPKKVSSKKQRSINYEINY